MKLWMAPMHGLTHYVYRNLWFQHFEGIDEVITPFVSLTAGENIKHTRLRDFFPENNPYTQPIPQIIGNKGDQLILMATELNKMGYERININLGCPAKQVVKHHRGSGLLRQPEKVKEFLSAIEALPHMRFSVKIRIGYRSQEELAPIVEVLNLFPLEFVCVHPRLGIQHYTGATQPQAFQQCINTIKHPIIYSGDITSPNAYQDLKQQFPSITDWMLGRKLISNPFLAGQIKGCYPKEPAFYQNKFTAFHNDLLDALKEHHELNSSALNKGKEYWQYFMGNYPGDKQGIRYILQTDNWEEFQQKTQEIIPLLNFSMQ